MLEILPVLIAFFVVTVSPGPANIALISVALSQGRRDGFRFALGLSIGLAFWGIVAATGLGVVLQASEIALTVLKVFGGLYLCWLAWQSAKSAMKNTLGLTVENTNRNWFLRGLMLNLSNPKAVVAWMAALSMGLGTDSGSATVIVPAIICMVLGYVNYAGHALVFSHSTPVAFYRRWRRTVDYVVASMFAIAGLGLLRSALARQ